MINLAAAGTFQGVCDSAAAVTYTISGMQLLTGVETYLILGQGQLPAATGVLYTSPASTQTFIKTILLANTTGAAHTCTFYVNGSAAGNQISSFSIPANGFAVFNQEGWEIYSQTGGLIFSSPITLTGDVTGSGSGTIVTTLATVNPNVGSFGTASSVSTITVNGKGLITAASNTPISITSTGVSDFTEAAQDAVGAALTDTATIDTTYNDGANTMTFDVKVNSISNGFLAQMPSRTIKGNNTAATANALDLTVLQVQAMLDVSVFNANEVGILTSNTGAQNVTAFNAWYATAPTFCTLYFPGSGFYDFASELTLNRDIRIRFLGCGKGRSILRTTSATAHLFNQTVAGFYISWEELGFGSTVTNKTAGSAIRLAGNNAVSDVRRCEFQNQFQGIELINATALNIGTINECIFNSPSTTAGTDTTGFQIGINGSNINMMIQNCTINVTGTSTTGLMINQSGAVQISTCDFIGGKNTLLVNATAVVSALYFSNVFFDQATFGSTVKFMGTAAISRVKFSQCGITNGGGSGLVACEIAGTGTGTGIPEAIDFELCDFYNNGFAGTTTGILVTGCRGFDIRNSRISGFTFGLDITPYNGNGVTNFGISGSTIGPTENFAGNGTGIRINAGAVQFGSSHLTNNDLSGNTTVPVVNNGTFTTSGGLILRGNIGLTPEPTPNIATPATFGAVETIIFQVPVPIGGLLVGSTVKFFARGIITGTTPSLLARVRIGNVGTVAGDAVAAATVAAVMTTATGWVIEGYLTIRTIGAGGTGLGGVETRGEALATANRTTAQTATVAVNTTAATFISLTAIGGGTTPVVTVTMAYAQVVRQ